MTPDFMTAAFEALIVRGRARGRITVGELNAALPPGPLASESIEGAMAMLGDLGIAIVEGDDPEDGEATPAVPPPPPPRPLSPRSGAEAPSEGAETGRGDANGRTR